ncbi:MAG TPA: hypothetical protein VHF28_06690 [Nitrososphaera sp.]|nr:hypothetical protein [Nitrososphaera sp.]
MARFCPARIHLHDIFEKTSSDNGTTFGAPINLSNNPGFSEHPQIAAYDNKVYAVWADDTSGNRDVLFTRSLENGADSLTGNKESGANFERIKNLSNNTSDLFNQEIAVFGDNVYVVWVDRRGRQYKYFYLGQVLTGVKHLEVR